MKGSKILAALVVLVMLFSTMVVLDNFIEEAGADYTPGTDTPGRDRWGNATTDLVYDTEYSDGTVKINTTKWTSNSTYYLYYPVYHDDAQGYADDFYWDGPFSISGYNVRVVATQANMSYIPGTPTFDDLDTGANPITFNRSGMWIFGPFGGTFNGSDLSSIRGYIWVNTSTEYVMDSVADFKYGIAGTKTFTVNIGEDDPGCMISIVGPDNITRYHKWRSTGISIPLKIATYFDLAGEYNISAYTDDPASEYDATRYYYPDENDHAYDLWYGSNLFGTFPTAPKIGPTQYNYDNMGQWDPPEKNATKIQFEVETGEPNVELTNTTVYWGFDTFIDLNVTNATGTGIIGQGVGTTTVKLKKGDTYLDDEVWINETGNGNYTIDIKRGAANWSSITNGTWRVVFSRDINNDTTEEWNSTAGKIYIKSATPPVRLVIANDGSGDSDDLKVDIPSTDPTAAGPAEVINISFTIYGRTLSGERAYYGDDAGEDYKNITISGDILYPIHRYSGALSGMLNWDGNGDWYAIVTPTKPGGTITIEIDWPGSENGSDSETIDIVNGTAITTSVDRFTVGEHLNLTVTIKDMFGDPLKKSKVYLFWKDGTAAVNDTTGDATAGNGLNGEYTFWIKPSEQGATAPKNITIAASESAVAAVWGYASVLMEKNHNMIVNCTPTTSYAGDATEYDIEITRVEGGNPDISGLNIVLVNETGAVVTDADDAWSDTSHYELTDEEIPLSGGTYYLFAYNATHDSRGQNATIIVTKYNVVSSPTVLAWLIDTSKNMTFQVTPSGNGTLTINNMSGAPNASSSGDTETVDIENGVGTLEEVNATTLGNITFDYTPEGGESRSAAGLVRVTTATATPDPATIYIGEDTEVTITVTHPATGAAIEDIRVGLDRNKNLSTTKLAKLPDDELTGSDGKAIFAIKAEASGNVTIFVKNVTDPDNPFVIKCRARKTMVIITDAAVNEGETFTVEAKSDGELITDVTVTMVFAGTTQTTTTGSIDFIAPSVSTNLNYRIEATAEGYSDDDANIMIVNVPALIITVSGSKDGDTYLSPVTVTVSDDSGNLITGATVAFGSQTDTTVNGQTSFEVTEEGSYAITATFTGFASASITISAKSAGIPGFELLTLIAAIGVALILLRRRRN